LSLDYLKLMSLVDSSSGSPDVRLRASPDARRSR
jgi:hypothetical protein